MARVQLDKLRKVYDNGHVGVAGASFEVADGERLVLVGPSGCGKTTLLRMVAGLEAISAGTLRIGERVVNDVAPRDRDIAMVFQSYALYPHMTVAENLAFALKLQGQSREAIAARVGEAARLLELEPVLERRPGQLSGGQRQRVALGRALVRQPQVFLLDEPLSNLDAKLRAGMRLEIARLHQRLGTTMIYVTHDQVEAMTLGQRIVVMRDGEVQQIDAPMALYARPANLFVATFLGSPAMNVVEARLRGEGGWWLELEGGGRLPLGDGARLDPAWEGRALRFGIRPEHLRPTGAGADGFEAVADVVETVGSEVHANLRVGRCPLVARLPPDHVPPPGSTVRLAVDGRHLHAFAEDGRSLTPR